MIEFVPGGDLQSLLESHPEVVLEKVCYVFLFFSFLFLSFFSIFNIFILLGCDGGG